MAATSTLKNLVDKLVKDNGWGVVVPSFTGTTTTLTLTTTGSDELRGPFTGRKIPIGSPIIITAGGTPLEDTYVSDWNPSTGVITVSPAITTAATDAVLITAEDIKHGDRIVEAIQRAGDNHVARWQKLPLTFVPDGDLLGGTVTNFWTASAGTAAYASITSTEVAGSRAVQITHSAAANIVSNTIPARSDEVWEFDTAIRANSAGDTATFSVSDITNTTDITVTYQRGSGTTTSRAFVSQRGTFTVPSTCDRIAFKLAVSGSGTMVAQMAPLVAWPRYATSFPLSNRVLSTEYVGNFYYSRTFNSPTGPEERTYSEPITVGGKTHGFSNNGDHLVVTFNFQPTEPVYYDELVSDPELTAMTSTTTFPLNHVFKWARYEVLDHLWQSETPKFIAYGTRVIPEPSKYLARRNAALRSAQGSDYEPEMINVRGRV